MTFKFDQFVDYIIESLNVSRLSPRDLYNFYYLWTTILEKGTNEYNSHVALKYLNRWKHIYIQIIGEIVYKQIRKYISRGRVDNDVTMEILEKNKTNYSKLNELMHKTYRSDMKRRNDVWNLITEYLEKLDRSNTIKDLFFYIDRLNNCIHNTSELLFSKFDNAQELIQAFEFIHYAKNLREYARFVDKEIRELSEL